MQGVAVLEAVHEAVDNFLHNFHLPPASSGLHYPEPLAKPHVVGSKLLETLQPEAAFDALEDACSKAWNVKRLDRQTRARLAGADAELSNLAAEMLRIETQQGALIEMLLQSGKQQVPAEKRKQWQTEARGLRRWLEVYHDETQQAVQQSKQVHTELYQVTMSLQNASNLLALAWQQYGASVWQDMPAPPDLQKYLEATSADSSNSESPLHGHHSQHQSAAVSSADSSPHSDSGLNSQHCHPTQQQSPPVSSAGKEQSEPRSSSQCSSQSAHSPPSHPAQPAAVSLTGQSAQLGEFSSPHPGLGPGDAVLPAGKADASSAESKAS